MNITEIERLKKGFFEGTLSDEEERQLKRYVTALKSSDETLQAYFSLAERKGSAPFEPLTKGAFFQKIDHKRDLAKKRIYRVAAIFAGFLITSSIFWYSQRDQGLVMKDKQSAEKTFEVTRLALNSFSSHLNKGMQKIETGIDFSKPYHSLKEIGKEKP